MSIKNCPICGAAIDDGKVNVDQEVLKFLDKLRKDNTLDAYLKVAKVYIDIIRHGAPTAAVVTKVLSTVKTEIKDTADTELGELVAKLPSIIQDTLQDKIPDSEQLQSMSKLLLDLLLTMKNLQREQEIPQIKGKLGEQELADELSSYFPEDEVEQLGKSGETDIILRPRWNGLTTGCEVMVESKKNNSGWRRSFIEQVRKHMSARGCYYAILAVQVMPKGANGYLTEFVEEGTIFVTGRDTCKMAYGALRTILLSEYTLGRKAANLQYALSDIRIQEAIKTAFKTAEHHESIRKRAKTIVKNANGIKLDADAADVTLRQSLTELQKRIREAIENMPTENQIPKIIPTIPLSMVSPSDRKSAKA